MWSIADAMVMSPRADDSAAMAVAIPIAPTHAAVITVVVTAHVAVGPVVVVRHVVPTIPGMVVRLRERAAADESGRKRRDDDDLHVGSPRP